MLQDARTQLACFTKLARQEEVAAPTRIAAAQALLDAQEVRERDLQEKYKELLARKSDLASSGSAPLRAAA